MKGQIQEAWTRNKLLNYWRNSHDAAGAMVLLRCTRPAPVRRRRCRALPPRLLLIQLLLWQAGWLRRGGTGGCTARLPSWLRHWPSITTAGQPCTGSRPSRLLCSGCSADRSRHGFGQRAGHGWRVQPCCQRQRLQVVFNIQGRQLAAAVLPKQVGQRLRAAAGHHAIWHPRLCSSAQGGAHGGMRDAV